MEELLRDLGRTQKYKDISRFFDESHCATVRAVGPCAKMIKDNNFETFQDWFQFYVGSEYFLKFKAATLLLYEIIKNKYGDKYDIDDCGLCLLYHVLVQTFDGIYREKQVLKRFQVKNPNKIYELSDILHDTTYGVDMFQINPATHDVECAFQIKPKTFRDRIMNRESDCNTPKLKKYKQETGHRVFYVFYDKEDKNFENLDFVEVK